jgi:hypothetical protein
MINGDQAQPHTRPEPEPECALCHDHGWIDDLSTATPFVRRCTAEVHDRELVSSRR